MKKLLIFLIVFMYSESFYAQWQWVSNTFDNIPCFVIESMGPFLFTGTDGNLVYRSSDQGSTWIQTNNGLTGTKAFCFAELSPYIYVGTNTGIFRSTNFGNNWTILPLSVSIGEIDIVGNVLYAIGDYFAGRSSNYGLSWENIQNGVSGGPYCIALQDSLAFMGTNVSGVYKSTNNCINWFPVNNGLGSTEIFDVIFKDNFVFLATGNNGGIFRTSNYGQNWQSVNNGFSAFRTFTLQKLNDTLYAGTSDGGVWKSANNGVNWSFFNDSLSATSIRNLRIINGYLWAASYNYGIWKRFLFNPPVSIQSVVSEIPSQFKLSQNFPNPFNPVTNILFDLPKESFVKLIVYNALGKEVSIFANQDLKAGSYKVDWNASNYPSGVYFYRLEAGVFVETKKMILIK